MLWCLLPDGTRSAEARTENKLKLVQSAGKMPKNNRSIVLYAGHLFCDSIITWNKKTVKHGRENKDPRYLFFFLIFLTFSSPKDIHKTYSDLIGTGFDSKSSNHKQWSYSSYDSSDPPEEKEYPVCIAATLTVLNYELTYSSGIANMFYMQTGSVSLAYWKNPVVKVNFKNHLYNLVCVDLYFSYSVWKL